MCIRDSGIGDGEPEPGTAGQVGRPTKAIEDLTTLIGGNARTRVVDHQLDAFAFGGDPDLDAALLRRVFGGVVDQDADQVIQPLGRGGDHVRIPAHPDAQPLLPRFGDGSKPLHRLLRHHADIDGLREACPRHRFEAREPQEIIDQVPHALAFLVDPVNAR